MSMIPVSVTEAQFSDYIEPQLSKTRLRVPNRLIQRVQLYFVQTAHRLPVG
jgi:hypothetical protein